jgi:acetyl esterase
MTGPIKVQHRIPFITRLRTLFLRFCYRLFTRWAWWGIAFKDIDCEARDITGEQGKLPVRVYRTGRTESKAIVLYFHGGGWLIGDLRTHNPFCRRLCHATGATVISVDYRLAPEHAFPAAALDCISVTRYLLNNKTEFGRVNDRVFVAGDSSGGNLAAVVAGQLSREIPGGLSGQVLIYPATKHYSPATASYVENATGHGLTRALMEFFWDTYLLGSEEKFSGAMEHPLATPLSGESFAQLPPALVITAGLDPLRDDGAEFANKLAAAGVACQLKHYADAEHGFVCHDPRSADHGDALEQIADWMHAKLST